MRLHVRSCDWEVCWFYYVQIAIGDFYYAQLCAKLCECARAIRSALRRNRSIVISTTRECRLKCMSLAINVQSSVTNRFYQEVAIRDTQSIWRFEFCCAAAQKLRSVCKRAFRVRFGRLELGSVEIRCGQGSVGVRFCYGLFSVRLRSS